MKVYRYYLLSIRSLSLSSSYSSLSSSYSSLSSSIINRKCYNYYNNHKNNNHSYNSNNRNSVSNSNSYHYYHTTISCYNEHDHDHDHHDDNDITLRWIKRNGKEEITYAKEGQLLLRAAQSSGIELEGACEGVCACSTCHVILTSDVYDKLPEPSEDEEDMLDQAFGLTSTSRLGCQIKLSKQDHNNMLIKIPSATRNFYVDGHVPKPH